MGIFDQSNITNEDAIVEKNFQFRYDCQDTEHPVCLIYKDMSMRRQSMGWDYEIPKEIFRRVFMMATPRDVFITARGKEKMVRIDLITFASDNIYKYIEDNLPCLTYKGRLYYKSSPEHDTEMMKIVSSIKY